MAKDKIFTLDQESLEDQLKKIDDLIKRDKESITENDAIANGWNANFKLFKQFDGCLTI